MTCDLLPFNSILVTLGQWEGDHEILCAMEPCLRLEGLPPPAGLEPETTRSAHQRFNLLSYRGFLYSLHEMLALS